MAIERRLTEIVGPLGGKLHTARSRNDQVATDLALYVRERVRARASELRRGADGAPARRSPRRHRDWPMPGLHAPAARPAGLPRPPPARLLLDARARRRSASTARVASTMAMPLGSGALAGLNWDLDRAATADELGFARPSPNSIDAVSNRDFALDYLYAAGVCATHLSRLGAELVLWSSQEFGFCEPADEFSSGSSIMPQKKNPDAAELLRGKAPRVVGARSRRCSGVLHALPLAYSRTCRRTRRRCSTPSTRSSSASRPPSGCSPGCASTASGSRRRPATRCSPPPTSPTCWSAGACPSARPTASSAASCAPRWKSGRSLSELDRRGARRALRAARRGVLRGAARAARGSTRRSPRAAPRRRASPSSSSGRAAALGGAPRPRRRVERARPPTFFDRSVHEVARDLIGCELLVDGVGGVIVETESYERDDPPATRSTAGPPRNEVLFGPPGHAYVYLSYGVHNLLNAVCEPEGSAAAVLIRALEPTPGPRGDARRRGRDARRASSARAPASSPQALGHRARAERRAADRGAVRASSARSGSGRGRGRRPGPGSGSAKATELPVALLRRGQPRSSRGRCRRAPPPPLAGRTPPAPRAPPVAGAGCAGAGARRLGAPAAAGRAGVGRGRGRSSGAAGSAVVVVGASRGAVVLGAPAPSARR